MICGLASLLFVIRCVDFCSPSCIVVELKCAKWHLNFKGIVADGELLYLYGVCNHPGKSLVLK